MRTITITLLVICLFGTYAHAKDFLDGNWAFQSATKNGNAAPLPDGDTIALNIRGSSGEVTITPGNPGVVETLIKQFCTKLYGVGKITYTPHLKMAKFDVSDVRGDDKQSFCPAARVLGEFAGKDVAAQLENHSLKLDFHYNTTGDRLVLTTLYNKATVALTFKKNPL